LAGGFDNSDGLPVTEGSLSHQAPQLITGWTLVVTGDHQKN
jgi:hypothetical protein